VVGVVVMLGLCVGTACFMLFVGCVICIWWWLCGVVAVLCWVGQFYFLPRLSVWYGKFIDIVVFVGCTCLSTLGVGCGCVLFS